MAEVKKSSKPTSSEDISAKKSQEAEKTRSATEENKEEKEEKEEAPKTQSGVKPLAAEPREKKSPKKKKLVIPKKRPEDMSLLELARTYPPPGWEKFYKCADEELEEISDSLEGKSLEESEGKSKWVFYPDKTSWDKALQLLPPKKIKVVILGQDPYPNKRNAVGLSFSVPKGVPVPPSLKNIYKELEDEYPDEFKDPGHGDLTEWVERGVQLLNVALTFDPINPEGKKKPMTGVWGGFTGPLIEWESQVGAENGGIVFILLGEKSQKAFDKSGAQTTGNAVVRAAHPSGLSASRGFFGSNVFRLANEALRKMGKEPVDWRLTPSEEEEE